VEEREGLGGREGVAWKVLAVSATGLGLAPSREGRAPPGEGALSR